MRFEAYYEDGAESFDAEDWPDALNQAVGHEGGLDGLLLRLEWSPPDAVKTINHMERTLRNPNPGEPIPADRLPFVHPLEPTRIRT